MKEVTMITKVEITSVDKFTDEELAILESKMDDIEYQIRNIIKSDLCVDDVKILKNQLFVRDVPDV